MRNLVLLLLLIALVGCRSGHQKKPQRDYTSINRSSRLFMSSMARRNRKLREQSWKDATDFDRRAAFNRRLNREGRTFAWEAITAQNRRSTRVMWSAVKQESRRKEDFWKSVRFGFLDSGE